MSKHLYSFVNNQPTLFVDYIGMYPGNPTHGWQISPNESAQLILNRQESADTDLDAQLRRMSTRFRKWHSKRRNLLRLAEIAGYIGFSDDNKFVFTCKYGWIDHGHFFNNALGVYGGAQGIGAYIPVLPRSLSARVASLGTEAAAYGVEMIQEVRPSADPTSAWGPEDLISNGLGREFGERMVKRDGDAVLLPSFAGDSVPAGAFFNIAVEWNRFLRTAGAVRWTRHATLLIKEDVEEFWRSNPGGVHCGTSFKNAMDWYHSRPLWRCLCDGDKAKDPQERY